MEEDKNVQFYREKTWDLLLERIQEVKENQEKMSEDIIMIRNKVNHIIGWAAGAGAVVSFIAYFMRNIFTGSK